MQLSLWACLCLPCVLGRLLGRTGNVLGGYPMKLSNFRNVQYTGPVTVGAQTLPVIYDTGSFEILVLSTLCQQCLGGTAAVYDHEKSATYLGTSVTTEHLFGSGPVRSEKAFEAVAVGGATSPYRVPRQSFWQIVSHGIAVWGPDAAFSGIVGLGFPARIPEGYGEEGSQDRTLLAQLGVSRFGLCLQRDAAAAPGWLTVEPEVPALFRSVPVRGQVHWAVSVAGFSVPGLAGRDPCGGGCGAIVDSGTSLIAVPPQARALVAQLKGLIRRDCANLHALPPLRFRLEGGVAVELPPQAYVMREGGWCLPAFMDIDKQSQLGPVFILGMPFLRYYHAIFDGAEMQIHLAESTPTCQVMPVMPSLGFVNTSGFTTGTRTFIPDDYEPLSADFANVRKPEWAKGEAYLPL